MTCPACNAPVESDHRFCPQCGAAITSPTPDPVEAPSDPVDDAPSEPVVESAAALAPGDPLDSSDETRAHERLWAGGYVAAPAGAPSSDERPFAGGPPPSRPSSLRHPAVIVGSLLGFLLFVGSIIGSAIDSSTQTRTDLGEPPAASAQTTEEVAETTPAPPPPVQLEVSPVGEGGTVHRASIRLSGYATPGAKVTVNGESTRTGEHDGRRTWSRKVALNDLGTRSFTIVASMPGSESATEDVEIRRVRSAAERRAFEAAQSRKRAEARERRRIAREQRIANFKASAQTIPYNQLNKNADKYSGDRVKYTGKILQIQEEEGFGGFMLLQVTDLGYDIWDDPVWVNYDRSITSAEDDVVTIYGTVVGSKSYETQIGGETYVPEIDAKYIEE